MASRAFSPYRPVEAALVKHRPDRGHRVQVARPALDGSGEARLLDLSTHGCRLASDGDEREGERVTLRLGGSMPIAASVVWRRGTEIGCRFDAPIARALMRSLVLLGA